MFENPLIGCWKLLSCVAIRDHGGRVPVYGKHPIGRLHYDAAGNMSVHIMRSGRPTSGRDSGLASGAELPDGTAPGGYQAYFSTYSVDTQRQIVRHEVQGSLFPDWTGTTQVRYYELQGEDRLLLRSAPIGAAPVEHPIVELVWERIAGETPTVVHEETAIAHR